MIKEIADILKLDVGAISPADDSIFSENKGVYYVKDEVKINSDIFEKFLKLKELKFLCFQESVIFENCVFDKENLKKIQLKYTPNPEFKNCVFKNVDLNSVEFPNYEKNISFLNCEFENIDNFLEFASKYTFEECVYESDFVAYNVHIDEDKFLPKIEIKNWTFKGKVYLKNITCNKEISFENINFNGKIDFSKSTFEKKVSFKNCKFNELSGDDFFDFSEIHFKDNVYFDDSYFNEFSAFHLCVFEKTASFYKTKFKVIPNFSPGDFKGILNINNATWVENGNLEFEDVRSIVKEAYGKSEKEEDELEKIRNIKDSFRAIKNVLIQNNNQLEAQKFHKAELYCKELELEKELETKNNKNFSTYIDSLLLGFYRITSDHHTNFLKILNFTVFCIAVYAVCSFVFVDIYTATFFGESRIFSKNTSEDVFSGLTFVLICLTIIVICYNFKDYKYTHKSLIWIILFIIFSIATLFIEPYRPNFARWLLLILVLIFLFLYLYFCNNEHKGIILFTFLFLCFFTIPVLSSIVYFFSDKDKNYDLLFEITIPAIISTYFCLIIFFPYLLKEIYLRKIKDKNLILSVIKYLRKRKYKNLILLVIKCLRKIKDKNLILPVFKCLVLVFKCLAWVIVAFVLYLYPQLINPFVGVFKSDEILLKNYFEKKLNDLNASEIIEISNLLKNSTDLNLTEVHKEIIDLNTTTNSEIIDSNTITNIEIIDSNTITNTEIINAKELIKQNLKKINIANNELNTINKELNATINTINDLKEKKDLQEYLVNRIKSSLLVYSIILLLCLYSLTKTARKNSIVPT
ncbi:MAG: pentapeptide repeat-containing protein [Campylobacter sp.]|nr:pentapeptide repeat-containing protein [Campylobacter sp.]